MITTIILPVSREAYLDQIFARLELMDCNPETTNILGIVDGDSNLFVKARNLIQNSRFKERLCVLLKTTHKLRHYDILARRLRIADIHRQVRMHLTSSTDMVLLVEDDSPVPRNALKRLLTNQSYYPHSAIISGIQVGRHGISHLGAWNVTAGDVYSPERIESITLPQERGMIEVDATGFYLALTPAKLYLDASFDTFDNNSLGVDVQYGLELRKQGYTLRVDTSLEVPHMTKNKQLTLRNTNLQKVIFTKHERGWRQRVENI